MRNFLDPHFLSSRPARGRSDMPASPSTSHVLRGVRRVSSHLPATLSSRESPPCAGLFAALSSLFQLARVTLSSSCQ